MALRKSFDAETCECANQWPVKRSQPVAQILNNYQMCLPQQSKYHCSLQRMVLLALPTIIPVHNRH